MASAAAPNSGPPAPAPPPFRAHLRGITSSNDDPDQCALCHGCIRYYQFGLEGIHPCCGKRTCSDCPIQVARRSVKACSCCGAVRTPGLKPLIGQLKKHAKMGTIWAQYGLGLYLCSTGSCVDGLRWIEKAAEGGHPDACFYLGRAFMGEREGAPLNYVRAREYLERAMTLDDASTIICTSALVDLADVHYEEGEIEAFNSILLPLANSGFSLAQAQIAVRAYTNGEEPLVVYPLFKSAVLGSEIPHYIAETAYWALNCSADLERFAIAKLLLPIASTCLSACKKSLDEKKTRLTVLVLVKKKLCSFRKECATCGTALDRSNRKLCRGCRNHCYCSRECQKMHWNRKKDGHSAECKEAQEFKAQIRDAGLMEKLKKK